MTALRLGVNVDHVATVRNARGGAVPDPVRAALLAIEAGADGITAHLREDRRHIRDDDMRRLKASIDKPLNFEMAATEPMLDIALEASPARLLPRAGEAHRAHDRRRSRRRRPAQFAKALRVRTQARGHSRFDVHRTFRRGAQGQRAFGRASRRAAHRRLVRRAGARRRGQGRSRIRPPAGGRRRRPRRSGSNATPATASITTPRALIARLAGDRRAQHRPFPGRRGDLRRARRNHKRRCARRWRRVGRRRRARR